MLFNAIVQNILVMTAWTTVLTTVAVMGFASVERKPVFAPLHAISHILFGQKVLLDTQPNPLYIVTGLLLNFSAMLGWAGIAELGFRVLKFTPGGAGPCLLMAFAVTILAYITDYHLVPKRFTPGFEDVIGARSLRLVYGFLAIGFLIGGLMRV